MLTLVGSRLTPEKRQSQEREYGIPGWRCAQRLCLLQVSRITFRNSTTNEEITKELSKEQVNTDSKSWHASYR